MRTLKQSLESDSLRILQLLQQRVESEDHAEICDAELFQRFMLTPVEANDLFREEPDAPFWLYGRSVDPMR